MQTEKEGRIKDVSQAGEPITGKRISFEECNADAADFKEFICNLELLLSSGDPDLIAKFIFSLHDDEKRVNLDKKVD